MVEVRNDHPEDENESQSEVAAQETVAPPTEEVSGNGDENVIAALENELVETRLQRDEYLDGWQRAIAEMVNFKKRVEREREQMYQSVTGNVIRRYLDAIDDLDRALKNPPKNGEGAAWAAGIELVYRKLLTMLESEGVKPMQAKGLPFDPNCHEAISHEESTEHESGAVIEVVQNGYLLGERVLRPARVRVAR